MGFPYETHLKTAALGLQVGISALSRRLAAGKSNKMLVSSPVETPRDDGYSYGFMEKHGIFIWVYMGLYGFIWIYMGLYGFMDIYIWLVVEPPTIGW